MKTLHSNSFFLFQLGDLMRNQLSSLQERWHLNLLHQSQLIQQLAQCKDKKASGQVRINDEEILFFTIYFVSSESWRKTMSKTCLNF